MELLHHALVLQPPSPQRFSYILFDKKLGVIDVLISKKSKITLPRGALIEYYPQPAARGYTAPSGHIIAMPELWACSPLFFLHHVCELILFFLPAHHPAENVFDHMGLLYEPYAHDAPLSLFQRFFVCRFFLLVGIYPEPLTPQDSSFLGYIMDGFPLGVNEQKYVFIEKKMIQWLEECIRLHPHADRLKTLMREA